jgi:hypothetical protein
VACKKGETYLHLEVDAGTVGNLSQCYMQQQRTLANLIHIVSLEEISVSGEVKVRLLRRSSRESGSNFAW